MNPNSQFSKLAIEINWEHSDKFGLILLG